MTILQIAIADEVVARLKRNADAHGRKLEDEAAHVLQSALNVSPVSKAERAADLLEHARAIRAGHPNVWITEDFLRAAKDEGRA